MVEDAAEAKPVQELHKGSGPGMPAALYLKMFGHVLYDAFGEMAYQVGSSVLSKEWRDVDIRLILPDDEYDAMFPAGGVGHGAKWDALCMAFSALGQKMTGLPIDFQIQKQSEANKRYPFRRNAIGATDCRYAK